MKLIIFLAITTFFLSSMVTQAGTVEQIEAMGATILSSGDSSAEGYKYYIAEKNGKKRIFHETPDGQYFIYGLFFDSEGNSVTNYDMITAKTTPIQNKSDLNKVRVSSNKRLQETQEKLRNKAYEAARNSKKVTEGSGKDVYVVFDPSCTYCKSLHKTTRSYLGTSTIHWIPVAVLREESVDMAATILEKGAKSITNIVHGIDKPRKASESDKKSLMSNQNVMSLSESNSVPVIIYKDKLQKTKIIKGLPPKSEIESIFN